MRSLRSLPCRRLLICLNFSCCITVVITKPSQCALITRPIEYRKRAGLCITGYLFLSYAEPGEPALLGEQSLWKYIASELNPAMLDEGVTKSVPEFVVHGSAYARQGSIESCAVRVRFSNIEKTLLVFGERYWHEDKPSKPESFKQMPISWKNAFGAEGYAPNTLGKGMFAKDGIHWLPNIESPSERLIRPDQKVTPAGFGLRDVMHPERVALRGTYDGTYLKEHSPGFVPDVDWRYFNLAPKDQWLPSPLVGNEAFSIENMHPAKPIVGGKLPSFKIRVIVNYALANDERKLAEVPMRLTTVWFFPHSETCVIAFQGLAEVAEDDGSDVAELLMAVERLGEEKSDAHYLAVKDKRKHPSFGAIHSLNDADLLPENTNTFDSAAEDAKKAFAMEGLQGKAQLRRAEADVMMARQQARKMGKDPDMLGIKMPIKEAIPTNAELPAYLEKQQKLARQEHWKAVEQMVGMVETAMQFEKQHGIKISDAAPRGPPQLLAPEKIAELRGLATKNNAINLAALYPKLLQKEAVDRATYLQVAHHQAPAFRMQGTDRDVLRREMQVAISKGIIYFSGVNFTGADFSQLDLRGANFSDAWLENANFSGSNLSNANLSGAVIAHADFTDAIAIGTNFCGANLGKASLKNAVFDNALFVSSNLESIHVENTSMRGVNLAKASLHKVVWESLDLSGAKLANQIFNKIDCKSTVFDECDLRSAIFIECDLAGVQMQAANISGATFHNSNLEKANLSRSEASKSMFVEGSSLKGAKIVKANFAGANVGGINFEFCDLVGSCFDNSNLTLTNFSHSDLRLSSAKGALCRRTKFKGAKLAGSNFLDAVLQHADLRGADFRRSNLFGADLSRVKLDANTKLDQSILGRARTYPRLTSDQQNALL
jgi:uncharacterized protein YjbI with pentapeptide repeats